MLVRNLTDAMQEIKVREITGEHREYDIFVAPNASTDIDSLIIVHPEKYSGIFDIEGYKVAKRVELSAKEEPTPKVEIPAPVVEETDSSDIEEPVVEDNPSEFICDICGAEFASARGLATHKHKAHE